MQKGPVGSFGGRGVCTSVLALRMLLLVILFKRV